MFLGEEMTPFHEVKGLQTKNFAFCMGYHTKLITLLVSACIAVPIFFSSSGAGPLGWNYNQPLQHFL